MLTAQTTFELRLLIRNGEQLLLALVIPVAALVGLTTITLIPLAEPRVEVVVPGVWTLAIMSAGFTSLAIATAFDRRYGVTKRLVGSGVSRRVLLAGKAASTALVVVGQLVLLSVVAVLLGWRPAGSPALGLLVASLGLFTFVGLGLWLGGTLKAEVVLGLANLIWLVLVALGGVIVPLTAAPGWLAEAGALTPAGALSEALRAALNDQAMPVGALLVLVGWAAMGWAATLQWFKWQ